MSPAAAESAHRYAWPLVAEQVLGAYEDAIAAPAARGRARTRAGRSIGAAHAPTRRVVGGRSGACRASSATSARGASARSPACAAALIALVALAGVAVSALAVEQIGVGRITSALVTSQPSWVVIGCALMCAAMVARGFAWHAILRAALPGSRDPARRRDAGHLHRRADERDAAGAARRAVALADRRPPRRPAARDLPDRARHDRLADAAQPARARSASAP